MNGIPRILVIDDQYGRKRHSNGLHPRTNFCMVAGLKDITGDINSSLTIDNPIAEAVFFQGQIEDDTSVQNDLEGTLDFIRAGWRHFPRWALILLDLQFVTGSILENGKVAGRESDSDPDRYFGLAVLERLQSDPELREIPVVLLSSMDRKPIEKRFADNLVCQFLDKMDIDRHQGRKRISELLENHGLIEDSTGEIIGHSIPLLKCLREARLRARAGGKNILILGERGTGKELLARYIHRHSERRGHLEMCFLQGCPETLVEDLLFGHVRGAYSGAHSDQPGAAERAHEGTLFIDEFGAVPPTVQTKLLRLLGSTREVQRMGSDRKKQVDLLVVLATNRMNLRSSGDFHADLLDRINLDHSIVLPSLKNRIEDIPVLIEHFVRQAEKRYAKSLGAETREIDPEAVRLLTEQIWDGNIRQLEEVIDHAVNRFPRLRLLSASHLTLPHKEPVKPAASIQPSEEYPQQYQPDFCELLSKLQSLNFDTQPEKRGEMVEALSNLKIAFATCAANLLRSALIATSKSTLEHPEGEIQITPAVNLISGQKKLTTPKCADEIKRLYRQSPPELQTVWRSDSVLNCAYETAVNLRPKQGKSTKQDKD